MDRERTHAQQRAARARVPLSEGRDLSHAVLPAALVVERSRHRPDARNRPVSGLGQRSAAHRIDVIPHSIDASRLQPARSRDVVREELDVGSDWGWSG